MSTKISHPGVDGTDLSRIHVPLELAIAWSATYTGSGIGSSTDWPATDISLKGGTGPSGDNMGALPAMSGIPVSDGGMPPAIDHIEVDSYEVAFSFTKHPIPAKIAYERSETKTDLDGVHDPVITTGEILINADTPTPTATFSATAPGSLDESFVCEVAFTAVYAPDLS